MDTATVSRQFDKLALAAWAMVRSELGCATDAQLARRLGLPTTYQQWTSGQRSFPTQALFALASATDRSVLQLLKHAEEHQ